MLHVSGNLNNRLNDHEKVHTSLIEAIQANPARVLMRLNFMNLTEPTLQPLLTDNQIIQAHILANTIMVSILIRFARVNSSSELKSSVIKHIPSILSYVIGDGEIDWVSVLGLHFNAHEPSLCEVQSHTTEEPPADLDDLDDLDKL